MPMAAVLALLRMAAATFGLASKKWRPLGESNAS